MTSWTVYHYIILSVWLLIGVSLIIFSGRIVNLMWRGSVKLWTTLGTLIGRSEETDGSEQQSQIPVWIIRIFGFLVAAIAIFLFIFNFILNR